MGATSAKHPADHALKPGGSVMPQDAHAGEEGELERLQTAYRRQIALVQFQLEQIRSLTAEKSDVEFFQRKAAAAEAVAQAMAQSTSWKVSAPIRALKTGGSKALARLRSDKTVRALRRMWLKMGSRDRLADAYTLPVARSTQGAPPLPVRLIAFYLPQFHPIPENSVWWGEGFTEWTNVKRGVRRFEGHAQPLVPHDLGYYDLLETSGIQKRQAELARQYGVEAFCFYFYWFAGKTLLEQPIQTFARNAEIDLPYCLCWANESWSRRWHGLEEEALISQVHSPDDDLAFIGHIAEHLRSPRYLRVDGRPVLLVYRPSLFPNPSATAERWRNWCRENDIGEIHLVYTQSFEAGDPGRYGFDAATEFPPNNTAPPLATGVTLIDPTFSGTIYDYRVYPARAEAYPPPKYPLYRGVFPAWDNEARRPGRGTSFAGATPELYRRWLALAARDTLDRQADPDQRLVFINAWNEWAEGAILEPDARLGYAHLQATRDALEIVASGARGRLVLVVHDAFRHGAQFLALNMANVLFNQLGYGLDIVLLGEGPLTEDFRRFGRVHGLSGQAADGEVAKTLADVLKLGGAIGAICNTTLTGLFLQTLLEAGIPCISLIHEMATLLGVLSQQANAALIAGSARAVVFPADIVRSDFEAFVGGPVAASRVMPQGAYKRNKNKTPLDRLSARARTRLKLGIPDGDQIVLGVGYGDARKGLDLFAQAAAMLGPRGGVKFVWVGDAPAEMARSAFAEGGDYFILTGFEANTDDFYSAADVYALTSREDPFPTVVLEAFDAGVPVVAFEASGGFDHLLRQGCGVLAPQFDVAAFAEAVQDLLTDTQKARTMGDASRIILAENFQFRKYVFDIAKLVDPAFKRISVVLPNYNYARFLKGRVSSIVSQTNPLYELIILDDCSTDDSAVVIGAVTESLLIPHQVHRNETNSGSVFSQWLKGVEAASGDLVWIAEADDLADRDMVANAVSAFDDPLVVMSYVQSRQIDGEGVHIGDNYLPYTNDISPHRWTQPYVAEGPDEVRLALSVKNTIPNVSGVLFRRDALLEILLEHRETLSRLRFAGDWFVYVKLLEKGRVAFSEKASNIHRRHQGGVTIGGLNARQLTEILEIQRMVRVQFDVPAHLGKRARDYAQELYEQFGLSEPGARDIGKNLLFSPYFEPAL